MELDDLVDVPTVVAVPTVILPKAGVRQESLSIRKYSLLMSVGGGFRCVFLLFTFYLGK